VIGGRLYADRLHYFRRYWCDTMPPYENHGDFTQEENEESRLKKANWMIEKFTREGVDEDWFKTIAKGFPIWREKNRIKQRTDAAIKSWTPENRKKRKKSFDRRKKQGK
jgi:hypothetical protein